MRNDVIRNLPAMQSIPALVVGTPYGGVKKQGAGISAQTTAELVIVPGAWRIDLYDRTDMIYFDNLLDLLVKMLQ